MIDHLLLIAIGINAAFLVFRRDYEDGLVGRVCLVTVIVGVVIIMIGQLGGEVEYAFPPESTIVFAGIAGFMARHTYRWLRWRLSGRGDWRDKYRRGRP